VSGAQRGLADLPLAFCSLAARRLPFALCLEMLIMLYDAGPPPCLFGGWGGRGRASLRV
jgi:hypothetical protein